MGQPKRAKRIVRELCLEDKRQLEALDHSDTEKWLTIAIYNGLMMCGNCPKRFKCLTDIINTLRHETNLDMLLQLLDIDDEKSGDMADAVIETFEILESNLDEDVKFEILDIWWDKLDIDPNVLLKSINQVFGDCQEYMTKHFKGDKQKD